MPRPMTLIGSGVWARIISSLKISCSMKPAPRPPYSLGQVMPTYPASWSLFCHARLPSMKAFWPSATLASPRGLFAFSQVRTSSLNAFSESLSSKSMVRSLRDRWDDFSRQKLERVAVVEEEVLEHEKLDAKRRVLANLLGDLGRRPDECA